MAVPFNTILDGILNTYNIDSIQCEFQYDEVPSERTPDINVRVTRCHLTVTQGDNTYDAVGSAYCMPQDRFVKHTGRVLALRRALNVLSRYGVHRQPVPRNVQQEQLQTA